MSGTRRELATLDREMARVIQAIKDGMSARLLTDELARLEARKATLTAVLTAPPPSVLPPDLPYLFRRNVAALRSGLEHAALRETARARLRGLVDRIVVPAGDGLLQVVGNAEALLAAAQFERVGIDGCGRGI